MISQDQIDEVLLDARAGELEPLQEFFDTHGAAVLPQIKDEYSLSTVLHMGAANGHLEIVKYLVDLAGKDVSSSINLKNESGNTPLHWACLNGHLDVVKVLCDAGADPFLQNEAKHDAFYEAEPTEEVIDYLLEKFSVEPDHTEQDEQEVTEKVSNLNVEES